MGVRSQGLRRDAKYTTTYYSARLAQGRASIITNQRTFSIHVPRRTIYVVSHHWAAALGRVLFVTTLPLVWQLSESRCRWPCRHTDAHVPGTLCRPGTRNTTAVSNDCFLLSLSHSPCTARLILFASLLMRPVIK